MICPYCGSENLEGTVLCDICGKRLSEGNEEVVGSNGVPVFVEGHLLWIDRFALLGLVIFMGVVFVGLSLIDGPHIWKYVLLGVVAIGWMSIYYILMSRR